VTRGKNGSHLDLARLLRTKERQDTLRWGPNYVPAIRAVRGEAPPRSGCGTLPSVSLQRDIHALSWPEKVAFSLALYAKPLEMHEQHVYYSTPTLNPLAFHSAYANLSWSKTDGTFALSEQLGVARFHPKVWKPMSRLVDTGGEERFVDSPDGEWRIGFYVGDLMLYMRAAEAGGRPYIRPWEVKESQEDHGRPGGPAIRRHHGIEVERDEARRLVCAAYAAQLGTTVAKFCLDDVPKSLRASMVSLCRAQSFDFTLPETAVVELVEAFNAGIGSDVPARAIARALLSSTDSLAQAKILLDHAVWQRKVRVDLFEPLQWDMPLLPEREDVLVRFHTLFAR